MCGQRFAHACRATHVRPRNVRVCMCICAFVHLCICVFVRLCLCAIVRLCVCVFVRLYVCAFLRLRVCAFMCLGVCACMCLCVCTVVWLCVWVFVCLHVQPHLQACAHMYVRASLRLIACPRASGRLCVCIGEHMSGSDQSSVDAVGAVGACLLL